MLSFLLMILNILFHFQKCSWCVPEVFDIPGCVPGVFDVTVVMPEFDVRCMM